MNNVSLHDVHAALGELGKFRFGDMRVEDALHEIVRTTHTMFGVDGAGLMLTDAEQHLRSVAASDAPLRGGGPVPELRRPDAGLAPDLRHQ